MELMQIPLGPIQTNCYILSKEDSTCLIVDPGAEGERLIRLLKEKNLKPVGVVLTHTHYDHIGAVDDVRDEYKVPVYVHNNEKDWLANPEYNSSISFSGTGITIKEADVIIDQEQELSIGGFDFQIFETPGHSPGSISLYFADHGFVCVGDALFNGSIGRTDLYMGNHEQLLTSIHTKLLTLPEETVVLPGHGPKTTIGKEMDSNPFLNGF